MTLAEQADKYLLYQNSVTAPVDTAESLMAFYYAKHKEPAKVLREDFCAAGVISAGWLERFPFAEAIGVDLDPEPINWGKANNFSEETLSRMEFIEDDVKNVTRPADIVLAHNFSHYIFKTRTEMSDYFQGVYNSLTPGGLFVFDSMAGPMTMSAHEDDDPDRLEGIRYQWELKNFDPISHECLYTISYVFEDGSELRDAFVYPWRQWSVPELRDIAEGVGFDRTETYIASEDNSEYHYHESLSWAEFDSTTITIVAYKEN